MPNIFEDEHYEESDRPRHNPASAKRISATFIGEDGSMGFRNGVTYNLTVSRSSIRREDVGTWVPYGSLEAFFSNWVVKG